jgi:hypothetical protein
VLRRSLPLLSLCLRERYEWQDLGAFLEAVPTDLLTYRVNSGVGKPEMLERCVRAQPCTTHTHTTHTHTHIQRT